MGEIRKITDRFGKEYELEVILSFGIDELGKEFLAYTLNDNKASVDVDVYIVELIDDGEHIKPLDKGDEDLVIEVFQSLMENN